MGIGTNRNATKAQIAEALNEALNDRSAIGKHSYARVEGNYIAIVDPGDRSVVEPYVARAYLRWLQMTPKSQPSHFTDFVATPEYDAAIGRFGPQREVLSPSADEIDAIRILASLANSHPHFGQDPKYPEALSHVLQYLEKIPSALELQLREEFAESLGRGPAKPGVHL